MELLLILGLVAAVILLILGGYLFLRQRRSGTIRAVGRPRRQRVEPGGSSDVQAGTDQ